MEDLEDKIPGRYKDQYGQEYTIRFYKGRYHVFMDKEDKEIKVNLPKFLQEAEKLDKLENSKN